MATTTMTVQQIEAELAWRREMLIDLADELQQLRDGTHEICEIDAAIDSDDQTFILTNTLRAIDAVHLSICQMHEDIAELLLIARFGDEV